MNESAYVIRVWFCSGFLHLIGANRDATERSHWLTIIGQSNVTRRARHRRQAMLTPNNRRRQGTEPIPTSAAVARNCLLPGGLSWQFSTRSRRPPPLTLSLIRHLLCSISSATQASSPQFWDSSARLFRDTSAHSGCRRTEDKPHRGFGRFWLHLYRQLLVQLHALAGC